MFRTSLTDQHQVRICALGFDFGNLNITVLGDQLSGKATNSANQIFQINFENL